MENNPEPSLDDLTVFLAVCDAAGFRAAAKRLGTAPSNVSDTVSRLEASLGVPLFTRTTRSVTPTEAGLALAERLRPLWAEARQALDEVASSGGRQVRGLLKLNVTGAVMVDILPPLISRFIQRHPLVRVELVVEDRLVDAFASGCVAGIRYGEHLAQDVIAVPVGPSVQTLALAAAPDYLRRRGMPTHPQDLMDHDCVRLRFSSGALTFWDFEKDGQPIRIDPPSRLVMSVTAAASAIDLTRAGHGMICTFKNWLDADFQTGALVPVLPQWWSTFEGPQLYFPRRRMPAPLRAFVDLLHEERAKSAPPPSKPVPGVH